MIWIDHFWILDWSEQSQTGFINAQSSIIWVDVGSRDLKGLLSWRTYSNSLSVLLLDWDFVITIPMTT